MTRMDPIDRPVPKSASDWIAPDCHGLNFFEIDAGLRSLLPLYLDGELLAHMTPHYRRLGEIAGGRLDGLSRLADRHKPVLHARDAFGRDEDFIEFHPAYREMERIALAEFGIHCMSRRPGVLGWKDRVPPVAKYAFQYLFVQSEFGLMCPISATETSALLIERHGDEALKRRFLPRMLSQDMDEILMGAQFMTERTGGSDVGNVELTARFEDGQWRLWGDKWFCSCADGDVAMLLARPEGAPEGTKGLGLFVLPRHLDDGSRNAYRTVRLKDKLGTRSMASGEIVFEGAVAYPVGEIGAHANPGLKQMMDQVNMSRLSHGVRAAAMMRRCLNEALVAARGRRAFGGRIIDKPLLRRQLMKLMLPTEAALSVSLFAADNLARGEAGQQRAAQVTRILTPLLKYRSARDNIQVATGAMEVRGGNGYIEDWVNPRLVRDAHLGVLWEGTSNINALDVVTRAIAKSGAHEDLGQALQRELDNATPLPGQFRGEIDALVGRAVAFADRVARDGDEPLMRQASNALYYAAAATLMATEGAWIGAEQGDARRLLLARMAVDHRLRPQDPLEGARSEDAIADALLSDEPVSPENAAALIQM
ncbi:acyl-CoA dehydrogenase family protein [Minwuia thermotolerans]|uniref:DNA alkylation response protein n=1 Tax=Minwuia thermotolerans TaxID=2056226 RepID=A0A2M9G143_9PROT|nr:acyl-CoA dehydrogenase family protein [Minwuia thermotolerans]PJK29419.1 DNA alkylation response protein [Minwuia thermotolerans]